jgi:hypothetical protein
MVAEDSFTVAPALATVEWSTAVEEDRRRVGEVGGEEEPHRA